MIRFSSFTDYNLNKDNDVTDVTVELLVTFMENDKEVHRLPVSYTTDDIDDIDGEWETDEDEDYGYVHTFRLKYADIGFSDKSGFDKQELDSIVEYATIRKFKIKALDGEDSLEKDYDGQDVSADFIRNTLVYSYNNLIDLDEGILIIQISTPSRPIYKTFAETPYGDLTGQTFKSNIDVSNFGLTSLKGAPKSVFGKFNCSGNNLETLEYVPETVTKHFDCNNNKLVHLEFIPFDSRQLTYRSQFGQIQKYLDVEVNIMKKNPGIPFDEMLKIAFDETGDVVFLPDTVKDIFIF